MEIKENIKWELIKMIEVELHNLDMRKLYISSKDEFYHIACEETFLNKLRDFVNSIQEKL